MCIRDRYKDKGRRHAADRVLAGKAWKRARALNSGISERAYATAVAAAMKAKSALGGGLCSGRKRRRRSGAVVKRKKVARTTGRRRRGGERRRGRLDLEFDVDRTEEDEEVTVKLLQDCTCVCTE